MPENHRTVFYSWQSDVPADLNRKFIEKALEEAIKNLHTDADLEPAIREDGFLLDKDTAGVPGSPPIAQTVLAKIERCSAFVADLTFVGQSLPELSRVSSFNRLIPNPNVLIEYGYALKCHSDKAIVSVINTAFGDRHLENLPFDLRHLLGPVTYRLADPQADNTNEVFETLVADLTAKLKLILASRARSSAGQAAELFSPATPSATDPSVFFEKADGLIPEKSFNKGPVEAIVPDEGRAFLRLYPLNRVTPIETSFRAREIASEGGLRPMGEVSGLDRSRNAHGAIVFEGPIEGKLYHFTQLFRSGEIWGVDAFALNATYCRTRTSGQSGGCIASSYVERTFASTLHNYLKFARESLRWSPPLVVQAGMTGIEGYPIAVDRGMLGSVLDDAILWQGEVTDLNARADQILKPFFEKMWEECGFSRPASYEKELADEMTRHS